VLAALGPGMASQPASKPARTPVQRRREVVLDAALAASCSPLTLAMLAARGDSKADARNLDSLGESTA
jgi:hypothetical protein